MIFIAINPMAVYFGIAIIVLAAIVQVILLLVQHNQSERLEKNIQKLFDQIDQLKH